VLLTLASALALSAGTSVDAAVGSAFAVAPEGCSTASNTKMSPILDIFSETLHTPYEISSSTLTGGSLLFCGRLREGFNIFRRSGNRGLSYLIVFCNNRFFVSDRVFLGSRCGKHIKSSKHIRLCLGMKEKVGKEKEYGNKTKVG
jgi:hypothetical protein